jgi:prepilin-type N-terminal cleavage/methylation domain-containing protein
MLHTHQRSHPGGSPPARHLAGFSLVEVIVALTIVVVITGIAIPTARAYREERKAREPVRELAQLVQEMRQRAMRENRAYQIVFDETGFRGLPFTHSYRGRDEFLKRVQDLQAGPELAVIERAEIARQEYRRGNLQQAQTLTEATAPEPVLVRSYQLPEGVGCEVLSWGDGDWERLDTDILRRWVFQPTGMLRPMRVRFSNGDAMFEVQFDPLTGEIQQERSHVG